MTLYKVLAENGSARMGTGKWHLPKGNRPGKWMPPIEGPLMPYANGYHLCRRQGLVKWVGSKIHVAEYRGEMVEADNKVVVRDARLIRSIPTWNERTAGLFACDCAEHVLHLFERSNPGDSRVRNAIEISRKVANGDLPKTELIAAPAAARAAVINPVPGSEKPLWISGIRAATAATPPDRSGEAPSRRAPW